MPPNTTSLLQPVDMGIKKIKTLYCVKLVNNIVHAIEDNLISPTSTAVEISLKVNVFQALQFLRDNFREVSQKIIKNYFSCCGFKLFSQKT